MTNVINIDIYKLKNFINKRCKYQNKKHSNQIAIGKIGKIHKGYIEFWCNGTEVWNLTTDNFIKNTKILN